MNITPSRDKKALNRIAFESCVAETTRQRSEAASPQKEKKNRRHEDQTTKYIVFATAVFNLIHAVLDLIQHFTE